MKSLAWKYLPQEYNSNSFKPKPFNLESINITTPVKSECNIKYTCMMHMREEENCTQMINVTSEKLKANSKRYLRNGSFPFNFG